MKLQRTLTKTKILLKNIDQKIVILEPKVRKVIGEFGDFLKINASKTAKFAKKYKKGLTIGVATLTVLTLSGILLYRYANTPRAPDIKEAKKGYIYVADGLDYKAYIGNRTTNRPEVNFAVGKSSVTFTPVSGNEKPAKPEKDGKKAIIFKDIYANIDYRYQTIPLGIKEEILIKKPTPIRTFPFFLDFKGATPQYATNNILGTIFYDDQKNYLFHFEKPFATDAKGARTDNIGISIRKDTVTQKYVAILTLDPKWMSDEKRVYPITVDPTIVHDTTSEFSSGDFDRVTDTGAGNFPTLETFQQELTADQSTVGLWHMNESSGTTTVADSSGYSNTGTSTSSTNVGTGKFGNSRSFNGTSETVSIANEGNFDFERTDQFTIEAWVKTSAAATEDIYNKWDGTSSNPGINLNLQGSGGSVRLNIINNTTGGNYIQVTTTANSTVGDNTWHHVAATYNGSSSAYGTRIYIDGISQPLTININALTATTLNNNTPYIGSRNGSSSWFSGNIDEVRVSRGMRSDEEIMLDAQRRPNGSYTSPLIDFGQTITTWNSLSWTELGVYTGDGETLKESTNLVAQWNLNETSGTTAAVAAGSCGSTCNGTLTNMTTSGQDAGILTGWTSTNRRWGAGAVKFDGSDDRVTMGDQSALDFTDSFTLSAWISTTATPSASVYPAIAGKGYLQASVNGYGLFLHGDNENKPACQARNSGTISSVTGTTKVNDGGWHYLVCVRNHGTNTTYLYIDGKLEDQDTTALASGYSSDRPFALGMRSSDTGTTWAFPYTGVIDSVAIFSRTLSQDEIMANYNAGTVDFQTRVGSTTDPNDGTWEAWKPTTNESQILSMNSSMTDSLISYWKLDETGGTRYDSWGTNDLTDNATVLSAAGKMNLGGDFESGNSEFLEKTDNASLSTGDIDYTYSAWVKLESTGADKAILSRSGATFATRENIFYVNASNNAVFITYDSSGNVACSVTASNLGTLSAGTWYFLVAWHDAAAGTCSIQGNNGTANSANETANTFDNTGAFRIGNWGPTAMYFDGIIDEVGFWKRTLTSSERTALYNSGTPFAYPDGTDMTHLQKSGGIIRSTDAVLKMEGSGSQKFITRPQLDGQTTALWHLDETSGTGAFYKDASANANNGTPTGTSSDIGISNQGVSFNGSSDYITVTAGAGSSLDLDANPVTMEAWVKTTAPTTTQYLVSRGQSGNQGYGLIINSTGKFNVGDHGGGNFDGATSIIANQWYYVVGVINGASSKIYVNGKLDGTGTVNIVASNLDLHLGAQYNGSTIANFFSGVMDEVRISGVARTADEVAETYRLGRGHYINETISSTDISGKNTLPFYIAADRPGTYLETFVGESNLSVSQPDSSTVGLWHLEEASDAGVLVKNASGASNDGTPTGTATVMGAVGRGRFFNGTTDYITLSGTSTAFSASNYTTSAWVRPQTLDFANHFILDNRDAGSDGTIMYISSNNTFSCQANGTTASYTFPPNTNNWYHIACTLDGSNLKVYLDGRLVESVAYSAGSISVTTDAKIGTRNFSTTTGFWHGDIDEVRVDNTARSADSIRQMFEEGLRSHPITIDFAATLDSGNLIASTSDTSFTVDATQYGLKDKGSGIYKGDKIIVRENYNGTEYVAQGTVNAVTTSTGAITVDEWDSGSTAPSGGYTASASVFKWQRAYWNVLKPMNIHMDGATNLSIRYMDGAEGRSVWIDDIKSNTDYLTTTGGSTITSSTGFRYFQYKLLESSSDTPVSATVSAVTIDYVPNTSPNVPTLDSPSNGATSQSLTPQLKTTATDPDSDNIQYKIQLCTNSGMTLNCQTFDQTISQTGWSGQNANGNTTYTSGTQGTYTVQSALSEGTTYYWRSYAIDPAGTNTFGSTQGSPNSFTTTVAPSAPTDLLTQGLTNPTGVTTLTPFFSAVHHDPDADSANAYQILVNTEPDFQGTTMWDSGVTSMTTTADNTRSPNITYAGSTLSYGRIYYWKIRFRDVNGVLGTYSTYAQFTENYSPNAPSPDSPANGAISQPVNTVLKVKATDNDSDYIKYKIQLCTDSAMTQNCQTFDQTSSQTGWSGQNTQGGTAYTSGTQGTYTIQTALTASTTYYWRGYAIDPAGTNLFGSASVIYSFTTSLGPETPTSCRLTVAENHTSLTINWTDNATDENGFTLEKNTDSGGFVAFQTFSANTVTYNDTAVANAHTYQYRVAATFTGGASSPWCTTNTVNLQTGTFSTKGLNFKGLNLN